MPGGGVLRDDTDWLLRDAVGSVRAVTDTIGAVTDSSTYTAFGEPRATGTSVFGFAGEQTDPNTLIHLRARGYNPAQGTFTAYDPVQPGAPSTAGWNHYTYTANNPTTWTDPTGEIALVQYGPAILFAAVAVYVILQTPPFQQAFYDAGVALADALQRAWDALQAIGSGIYNAATSANDASDDAASDSTTHGDFRGATREVDQQEVVDNGDIYQQEDGRRVYVQSQGNGKNDVVVLDPPYTLDEVITVIEGLTDSSLEGRIGDGRWTPLGDL